VPRARDVGGRMLGRQVQTSGQPTGDDPVRRGPARDDEVVEGLRTCPDLTPLLGRRTLRTAELHGEPCTVDDDVVLLDPSSADTPVDAAMAVREALELASARASAAPSPVHAPAVPAVAGAPLPAAASAPATPVPTRGRELAWRILAHLTAVAYTDLVRGLGAHPSRLTSAAVRREVRALADVGAAASSTQRRRVVAAIVAALHDRAVVDDDRHVLDREGAVLDDATRRATDALVLALPTAVLLTAGGDDRLVVDWAAGENRYGVGPVPLPQVRSYSSCTASSPSPVGYAAGDRARRRLLALALDAALTTGLDHEWEELRRALVTTLLGSDAGDGVVVIPTPSGTDADSLALAVAAGAGRPVTTVLVAPLELGSGTALAVVGRAFSPRSPDGSELEPGALLEGMPADTRWRGVEVRDRDGRPRNPDVVEAEIDDHLASIVAADRQAVLHVVEGSKTGVRLPRSEAIARWAERYGQRLDVVIDAAQLRVEATTVAAHVAAGRLAIVTGSKFLAGPPFSGALLVPRTLVPRLRDRPCPDGLGAYLDRAATPPALRSLRRAAPPHPNVGLLLRWQAARAEHEAYLRIPPDTRDRVLRHLAAAAREHLAATAGVELVGSAEVVGAEDVGAEDVGAVPPRLEDVASIFTFRVRQDERALDLDELRTLQRLLRTDLSAAVTTDVDAETRALLSRRFAFGQPVPLGPDGAGGAGLRLAFGAPTLTRVVHDGDRGPDLVARLDREAADLRAAFAKLRAVLDHRLVA
jgi:hypothetical protein